MSDAERFDALVEKVVSILDGIDRTEIDDGWWETSHGAAFGAEILRKIRAL